MRPRTGSAAARWFRPRIGCSLRPGAHPALLGILGVLAKAGDVILSESLTYPGTRSIAAQLGLQLVGLPMDDEGVDADAFADACKRLTPQGALSQSDPAQSRRRTRSREPRRIAIVAIARRFGVPIIEDDPYGFLPTRGPPPFAALAPDTHLACGRSRQMPRRRTAHRLCCRTGRSLRLAVRARRCEPRP